MFNFRLFFHLILRSFSLSRKSLRYPSLKRIAVVLFVFPLYLVLLLVNSIFLGLDFLIFPRFRNGEVSRAVFITGVPRSASTYVLSNLARDSNNFTCFKFWELMFAPSILQKYLWNFVILIDRRIGRPLKSMSGWIDRLIFGSFRGIHDIGLSKPEEDEIIFMYTFTSAYLSYFFPGLTATDKYLLFDDRVSEREKESLLGIYLRFVQRHNYVYNRKGKKYFVSKNPSFVSKLGSIAERFPEAKILYLLRSPHKTIPATISLNAHIYSATCRLPEPYPLIEKTREMMARWYIMADLAMKEKIRSNGRTIYFKKLTGNPKLAMLEIYNFLSINPTEQVMKEMDREVEQSKKYRSPHTYDAQIGLDGDWFEQRLGYLFTHEIIHLI